MPTLPDYPPSYRQGFARCAAESQRPELWRGLVAAWVPSLGVTGNRLFDWAGRAHHGWWTGTCVWTASQRGPAILFNGSSYLRTAPRLTSGLPACSVSVWAKRGGGNYAGRVLANYSDSSGKGIMLRHYAGLMQFFLHNGSTTIAASDSGNSDTLWHHYGCVYDGSKLVLYIDGVAQSNQPAETGVMSASAADFCIGCGLTGSSAPFTYGIAPWNGQISSVLFYRRALDRRDILDLYVDPPGMFRVRRSAIAPLLNRTTVGRRILGLVAKAAPPSMDQTTNVLQIGA